MGEMTTEKPLSEKRYIVDEYNLVKVTKDTRIVDGDIEVRRWSDVQEAVSRLKKEIEHDSFICKRRNILEKIEEVFGVDKK